VQLYVADHQAAEDRPPQSLKGFSKVYLEAGESRDITIELPVAELAVYCPDDGRWTLKPGSYSLCLGSSSRDIRRELAFELQHSVARTDSRGEDNSAD
jgi:beta-glucosidase